MKDKVSHHWQPELGGADHSARRRGREGVWMSSSATPAAIDIATKFRRIHMGAAMKPGGRPKGSREAMRGAG